MQGAICPLVNLALGRFLPWSPCYNMAVLFSVNLDAPDVFLPRRSGIQENRKETNIIIMELRNTTFLILRPKGK